MGHHRDPETKQDSMPWKHKCPPTPMKFRVQQSARKIIATVFSDSEGVLLLEFMPHKIIITGDMYASTMVALCVNMKQRRRGKLSVAVLLLHDNAPVHTSGTSRAAIRKCGFVELNHPPHSPDLAPSDFFFFGNLEKSSAWGRFPGVNAVKEAVTGNFDTQDVSFFVRVFDH